MVCCVGVLVVLLVVVCMPCAGVGSKVLDKGW